VGLECITAVEFVEQSAFNLPHTFQVSAAGVELGARGLLGGVCGQQGITWHLLVWSGGECGHCLLGMLGAQVVERWWGLSQKLPTLWVWMWLKW
jgi:hypothetical protein